MDPQEIHLHHKIPLSMGGTDSYNNLVMLSRTSHQFVHDEHLKLKDLPAYINLKQLNKFRKLCGYHFLK